MVVTNSFLTDPSVSFRKIPKGGGTKVDGKIFGGGGGGEVYSEPFDFIGHSSYFLVDNI